MTSRSVVRAVKEIIPVQSQLRTRIVISINGEVGKVYFTLSTLKRLIVAINIQQDRLPPTAFNGDAVVTVYETPLSRRQPPASHARSPGLSLTRIPVSVAQSRASTGAAAPLPDWFHRRI
jgi:hypothetical protein